MRVCGAGSGGSGRASEPSRAGVQSGDMHTHTHTEHRKAGCERWFEGREEHYECGACVGSRAADVEQDDDDDGVMRGMGWKLEVPSCM